MASRRLPPEQEIVADLRQTLTRLIDETHNQPLTTPRRRDLEREIRTTMEDLAQLLVALDPIRQPRSIFDPSNPKIVGRFISLALVAQPRQPLANTIRFYGSGIYAIYYNGHFPLYQPLSNTETSIYVGQAGPSINNARTPMEQGDRLWRRLEDHRKNIGKTSTLSIDDFEFRSLVVQSGWETGAEDYLIHLFHPIWNSETDIVYGIGKHGDAPETRANRQSPWHTLHPGRNWAISSNQTDAKSLAQINAEVTAHFLSHQVYLDLTSVLDSFIEELRQI